MPTLTVYSTLRTIALDEFADVVVNAQILSLPTGDLLKLRLSDDPEVAIREFLTFVRRKLLSVP